MSDPAYSSPSENLREKLTKERRFRRFRMLEAIVGQFSSLERLLLYAFVIALGASAFTLLAGVNAAVSVTTPAHGGALVEGEVGPARFVNPILTLSQPDEDLSMLVYSGLMRALPDGSYIPDLASSYDISSDGTIYTFHIRPDATFHDGTPLTAADVVFTIQLAQNAAIKSPRRADWEGVQVSTPDPRTVVFHLPHAYAPFMENATLGILPKHLWENVSPEEFPFSPLNTHPVGSGPYRLSGFETDSTGSATRYDLVPFQKFAGGAPYLSHITLLFYPNQSAMIQAFNDKKIDAIAGISSEELPLLTRKDTSVLRVPLPRTFGIFFNQNHSQVLADQSVRAALDAALNKRALVENVLNGYAVPLESAIPPGVLREAPAPASIASTSAAHADSARAILSKAGWTLSTTSSAWTKSGGKGKPDQVLSFTLATGDEPELVATANAVAADWRAAGINVKVQVYPLSELNSGVIRPRNYDAILFGEVVGRSADVFAFWHSSQRNDPGLNLAMYANAKTDALLSEARATSDVHQREKLYAQFAEIIAKDRPAIFLYAPDFIYVVPTSLRGVALGALSTPAERFLNVREWYTDTERIWSIFSNQ